MKELLSAMLAMDSKLSSQPYPAKEWHHHKNWKNSTAIPQEFKKNVGKFG
jgi:hypothetical protein